MILKQPETENELLQYILQEHYCFVKVYDDKDVFLTIIFDKTKTATQIFMFLQEQTMKYELNTLTEVSIPLENYLILIKN